MIIELKVKLKLKKFPKKKNGFLFRMQNVKRGLKDVISFSVNANFNYAT